VDVCRGGGVRWKWWVAVMMVAAAAMVGTKGEWRHVMESGVVDLVDRGGRSIFGVRWKSSPEKSFGGGGRRVVAGGGEVREGFVCV
nr:hypothetical protein [Tanacetum cinerariifolium]